MTIQPKEVLFIGERQNSPFADRSGSEVRDWLAKNGLHFAAVNHCYLDSDGLYGSISDAKLVVPVGRAAVTLCVGEVDMDAIHGVPQESPFVEGQIIIPVYHPQFGQDADSKGVVYHDYKFVADVVKGRSPASVPRDQIQSPSYREVDDNRHLAVELANAERPIVALDTEGIPADPWSFQISTNVGTGLVIRYAHPAFGEFRRTFLDWLERYRPKIVIHNTLYDLAMSRAMGIELTGSELYDTMVVAYLLRTQPQSLKNLARRFCGMKMMDYREMIGDAADLKRSEYLWSILEAQPWPVPEPRLIVENDNTTRVYKPQSIERRVEKILTDWGTAQDNLANGIGFKVKPDAKEDFDVEKRFNAIDHQLRRTIIDRFGDFPDATLDDVPRDRAVYYSGRDPDATLRVHDAIDPLLDQWKVRDRFNLIMSNLPSIEEMQFTGMLADRASFTNLQSRMVDDKFRLCAHLSHNFNDGQPINPNSGDQVAALMHRRGLVGLKKTKGKRDEDGRVIPGSKKMSTNKKSIEHLRHEDKAIADVIDWRERDKTDSSFCAPILERIPENQGRARICCNIRVTRVSSSRLSASDPPLLAIPVRHELGVMVRSGFVAPSADDLVNLYGVDPDNANDCLLGTWDLSQIEMRVMAHLSKDPLLIKLFREGRDIHVETASRIFGKSVDEIKASTKNTYRNPTKRAGFGVITGIQGPGLLDQLRMMGCEGWDEESCAKLIDEWFKVYPGVSAFMESCRSECRKHGYVRDMGGMLRHLPGIWSREGHVKAEAERQSHSHIIQGSAQWMLQRAMSWLRPQISTLRDSSGMWVRWLLQVHDELLFGFDARLSEVMHGLVLEALTQHSYNLIVPVEANGGVGLTWGALEK